MFTPSANNDHLVDYQAAAIHLGRVIRRKSVEVMHGLFAERAYEYIDNCYC